MKQAILELSWRILDPDDLDPKRIEDSIGTMEDVLCEEIRSQMEWDLTAEEVPTMADLIKQVYVRKINKHFQAGGTISNFENYIYRKASD
jgi:hypothetical protein